MKVITFCDIDDSILDENYEIEFYHGDNSGGADILILDINSIFDFEENKGNVCSDVFVSIAIIDDENDYDAFKNFGIDAWINREDLQDLNSLLHNAEKRFL